jgi:hypothetical protein
MSIPEFESEKFEKVLGKIQTGFFLIRYSKFSIFVKNLLRKRENVERKTHPQKKKWKKTKNLELNPPRGEALLSVAGVGERLRTYRHASS